MSLGPLLLAALALGGMSGGGRPAPPPLDPNFFTMLRKGTKLRDLWTFPRTPVVPTSAVRTIAAQPGVESVRYVPASPTRPEQSLIVIRVLTKDFLWDGRTRERGPAPLNGTLHERAILSRP